MTNLVTVTVDNHIADVRLNRPEKMNALSWDMFDAIVAAAKQVADDRSVRAVVLSGEGRSFCAGMDLENFATFGDTDPFGPDRGGFWPNYYQAPAYLWKAVPAPVICALQGVAYGGGMQIALGADIRFAHPQTRMSLMEIKWGIVPDMSATQTLRDLVRLDIAKELTYTGRVVEGEEAAQIGLVTHLSENPLEAAMDMARLIASKSPDATSRGKYMLENTWHGDSLVGLATEERVQARILKQANQIESVMASLENRQPNFADRDFGSFADLDPS